MAQININKALRIKNALIASLKETRSRIQKNNTAIIINDEGVVFEYKVTDLLKELADNTEKLITLKVKLAEASNPIRDKIFHLSELKSMAAMYQTLKPKSNERGYQGEVTRYANQITLKERDETIKKIEKEIESLQDEITGFNYNTTLEYVE